MMDKFKPYSIEHIQLSDFHNFIPIAKNYYVVIWYLNIPLGHIWLDDQLLAADRKKLNQLAVNSVKTTFEYYVSQHPQSDKLNWQTLFFENKSKELNKVLSDIFKRNDLVISDHKLSVVICTRNRSHAIEGCIKSLLNSADKDFELIIVDNAPDDDLTAEIVSKYPNIKYVKEPRKGLDIARNTGAIYAKNEIVAYTDDDVIVDKNWTKQLKTLFTAPKTMAVTGLVIPIALATKAQYTFEKFWGFNNGYLPKLFDEKYFADHVNEGVPVWNIGAGANMAFRREIFEQVGWFDERLDVGASGCSGDSEFWYRILAEGYHCHYFPQLFVFHQHREEIQSLKKQIFSYMRGQVSSILVQYENYRNDGDMFRLKKILPKYYGKKLLSDFLHLRPNSLFNTINEVRGCISGWLYYRKNRNVERKGNLLYLKSLKEEVIISQNPLVSIIIPCYNHGKYLPQAIESVLKQSHQNFEIIVIDDGSTDDTAEVCKNYANVKYYKANRLGLSAARNRGVFYARGDFFVFLDADDFLYPDGLKINLNHFQNNKKVVFVSGAHDKVNDKGEILPSSVQIEKWADNFEGLLHGNYIAMEGTVMYRSALFYTFYFDPLLKACEDYDINLNITRNFPSITHSGKIAAYRIHDYNMSADKNLMLDNVIKVLQRQHKYLTTDKEMDAYQNGLKNWEYYYSN
ncbi:glycosyltransferase family 2 protein [Pedobacter cryotolerans]|uniref:Glycosyltransferase n=1 Tax=Pedobacter cryotolerans TaxID=2571270 RepID=A0A4V5NY60_9SPHI|nr:glycosyltransferase [Pedobacter cryotolerans]TKC02337.1 glycosyltransferase [Pedobacter cryotolerans]